jgi:hypothetical protein
MLHLALAALLAGSLGSGVIPGSPDGDKDKSPRAEAAVGLTAAEEAPVTTTFAFGQPDRTVLKVWAGYGWGQDDAVYDPAGNEVPFALPGAGNTEITSQRIFVGAQVNALNFPAFSVGVGGELAMVSRKFSTANAGDLDNGGFGLQQARVFLEARGRVLGVHGGYIFDLGEEPGDGEIATSDQSDVLFFGASFDYPATWLRLFGGIDYYAFQDADQIAAVPTVSEGTGFASPSLLVFNMGAGVIISWVEIGAAAIIRTNSVYNRFGGFGAGHNGSIAPYLNISPPAFPVSISVRGAFTDEYTDYGYSLGGSLDLVTHRGFTAALTYGF